MTEPSIFTKIINGELPCHRVYEDERTLAFMDINPIEKGQVLVVPKQQVPFLWDLEDEDYIALMRTVQLVGKKMRDVFAQHARVGVHVEGLDVTDHVHVKVFPFSDSDTFRRHPNDASEPDRDELAEVARKLHIG
jgi:histidine triad (HIT) family protein